MAPRQPTPGATRNNHHNGEGGPPNPGQGNAQHRRRQQMIGRALAGVQAGLIARGVDPGMAIRFAQVVLSNRDGGRDVTIGKRGIHYNGRWFKPEAFATSKLADYITGLTAEHQNQAAIKGDAGYQTDLANLTLQQQLSTAGLDEQRRRAILDFGSPAYTQDGQLAGEAAANPFSVQRLLANQAMQNRAAAQANANHAGTLFGGGAISGQAEAGRQYAGAEADATQKLVDLLAGLSQQSAQAGSIFQTGQQTALQAATQRLMESGVIHAAHAPQLGVGQYAFFKPPHRSGGVKDVAGPSGSNHGGGGQDPTRGHRRAYPAPPPRPGVVA